MRKINLLFGLLMAMLVANAEIVYTDINPDGAPANNMIDFNGDGTAEFTYIYDEMTGTTLTYTGGGNGTNIWANGNADEGWDTPKPLTEGTSIGTNGNFIGFGDSNLDGWGNNPFPANQERYIGCRLSIGGQTYYGWIRVEWNGTTFSFKDFAYENTPNTPINAGDATATPTGSDAKDILSYSLPNQEGESIIDNNQHKITINMPAGTAINNLVATFTLSELATAKVNGVAQESGVTANNWDNSNHLVQYVVTAENGSTVIWKIYIEQEEVLSSEAEILEFKMLPNQQKGATIYDRPNASIEITLQDNVDLHQVTLHKLQVSEGAKAYVNEVEIIPLSTVINFNDNNIVKVVAADGTVKNWTINFKNKAEIMEIDAKQCQIYPNPAKEILNIEIDATIEKCEIYNISGQLILESTQAKMNVGDLKQGIYLVKIMTSNGVCVKQLIKQ